MTQVMKRVETNVVFEQTWKRAVWLRFMIVVSCVRMCVSVCVCGCSLWYVNSCLVWRKDIHSYRWEVDLWFPCNATETSKTLDFFFSPRKVSFTSTMIWSKSLDLSFCFICPFCSTISLISFVEWIHIVWCSLAFVLWYSALHFTRLF